jgi:polyvinyl alcohol dehydrogenase (cytochrome)
VSFSVSRTATFSETRQGRFIESAKDGSTAWEWGTNQEFKTINKVKAHGGSMSGPALVVAGAILYVYSGYGRFGSRTGTVLLAFSQ